MEFMPKRYTTSDKWSDAWFQPLAPDHKLLFIYLCDVCDLAGVWSVNLPLAAFQLGITINPHEFLTAMAGRVILLHGNSSKWHLPKFVSFQQGPTLNYSNRAHQAIKKLTDKHGLPDPNIPITEGPYKGDLSTLEGPYKGDLTTFPGRHGGPCRVESCTSNSHVEYSSGESAERGTTNPQARDEFDLTSNPEERETNPVLASAPADLPVRLREVWGELARSDGPDVATKAWRASTRIFGGATTSDKMFRQTYGAAVSQSCLQAPAEHWPDFRTHIARSRAGLQAPTASMNESQAEDHEALKRVMERNKKHVI